MNINKYVDLTLLKRVIALGLPYKRIFALAGILSLLLAPVIILRPYLIQRTVDEYIMKFDGEGLMMMVMLLLGVLVLESVMRYVFIYSTSWLGQSVIRDLRVRVFKHITSLRLTYFDRTPIGTSTTRTINDIETINTVFSQGMISIIADVLTLFAVLAIMLFTSWKLTLICLVTFPMLIWGTYIFKEKVKAA